MPLADARPAAVSFDVTGTLLGLPRLGEIYAEAFARHGIRVDAATIAPLVREVWQELSIRTPLGVDRFRSHPDGARGFWRELVTRVAARLEPSGATIDGAHAGQPASPFLAAELVERFAHADAWNVYPDAREVLPLLRASGIRLAVVSNFDGRLPRLLADTGLGEHFETVVWSEDAEVEKPHPAIFEMLLERLALPPEQVLHVGDSRRDDVEGAHAIGMRALWLQRERKRGDLTSLRELPARLGLAPAVARS